MYDEPGGLLYAPPMRTELIGMEELRKDLAQRLTAANPPKRDDEPQPEPVHSAVTQRGRLTGVLVGIEWYREAREALGQPTDL